MTDETLDGPVKRREIKVKTIIKELQKLDPESNVQIIFRTDYDSEIPLVVTKVKGSIISARQGIVVPKTELGKNFSLEEKTRSLLSSYTKLSWRQKYTIYLNSERWQQKRLKVLERDNYLCQSCLKNKAIQVHHLSYDLTGNEPLFDLTSVCSSCHDKITILSKTNRAKKFDEKYIFGSFADYIVSKAPNITYDDLQNIECLQKGFENKHPILQGVKDD